MDENSWKTGYTSLFEIWGHYDNHYRNLIHELKFSKEKINEHFNEFNFGELDLIFK